MPAPDAAESGSAETSLKLLSGGTFNQFGMVDARQEGVGTIRSIDLVCMRDRLKSEKRKRGGTVKKGASKGRENRIGCFIVGREGSLFCYLGS